MFKSKYSGIILHSYETSLNMIQKVLHHLLKVTLKNQKGNFKIASSLEMLQQVLTSGFTNLEVFLKENQIENSKLHHHLL